MQSIKLVYTYDEVEIEYRVPTDLTALELADHLGRFMLALGYHPDNVSEVIKGHP